MNALLKFRELAMSLLILPGGGLDESHLPLDLLQLLLGSLSRFHGLSEDAFTDQVQLIAGSADHSHTTAPAQLFHPGDKITIRQDIIAFCLHHHHEIPGTFHVK
jgi:hypothetical protein